jgi:transposase
MCSQSISGARTRKHGDHPHICVLRWLRVPRVFLSAPLSSDAVAFYLSRGAQHLRDGKLATSYLDGGFDSAHNRKCIFNAGLIPNIKENPRNRKTPKRGRKRFFNAAIHVLRMRVERTVAWEDKFKRLLIRFERIQQRHYGMKLLAYTLINLRAFCGI